MENTTLYDAPSTREVPVTGTGFSQTWSVRELSAFEIARHQDAMLAVAVALYGQESVQAALREGRYADVQFQPMAVLAQVPEQLLTVLTLATGQTAERVEAVSYASLPLLIAAFVEANAPFFTDYVRRLVAGVEHQENAPAAA